LADPNTRQGKRTPVTLKIKFKSETLEQFIERYAVDVSQGGIFIRTKEPLAVGTQMKFEFQLRDASPLIAGEGTVVWTRENDPSRPAIAPGMGVRFDKLAEGSQQVLEKILAEKAKQAPQRAHTEQTKPPMFTDTPTRVAPAPVQEALLGNRDSKSKLPRPRSDSEQTPLPKPVPFHSDADEYPEEAFEEATKIRSLDELVAATAEDKTGTATAVVPRDELAARRKDRADSTLADPPEAAAPKAGEEIDRESAPGLPSPPESGRKVLDTSPSPRPRTPSEERRPEAKASQPPPSENPAKTKLGIEPAKAATGKPDKPEREERTEKVKVSTPREAPGDVSRPAARPSNAPIIIGALVVVAAGLAALWFFVLREDAAKTSGAGSAGSAIVETVGSDVGSAAVATGSDVGSAAVATGSDVGSAVATTGSAGSAVAMTGSAATPAANAVDTVIASPAPKATISVEGQTGPAPFTAKLEKGKAYKAHVTAPGFVAKDIDVKGGEKATAKLDPKPRTLSVTSDPPGAEIFVDGVSTGKQTPADVTIGATKTKARITLRKAGYKPLDQQVDVATFTEDDAKLSGSVAGTLEKAPVVTNTGGTGTTHTGTTTGTGTGSATTANGGTGAGSATTTTGTGAGSATTSTGSSGTGTTHTGTGTGSATTGTGGTGTTGTGTSGTGTTGTGTGGTGTSGAGTTGTGTGSATKPAGGGEPEPDWSKQK
jgi:uncharacterized protein (TIGR02266 family)